MICRGRKRQRLKCLMYDENGTLMTVLEKCAYCNDSGSTDYETFSFPLDATYRLLRTDSRHVLAGAGGTGGSDFYH